MTSLHHTGTGIKGAWLLLLLIAGILRCGILSATTTEPALAHWKLPTENYGQKTFPQFSYGDLSRKNPVENGKNGTFELIPSGQYFILNDLTEIGLNPHGTIISKQPLAAWLVPFGVLLAFDRPLQEYASTHIFEPLGNSLSKDVFIAGNKTRIIFESFQYAYILSREEPFKGLAEYAYLGAETVIDAWIISQGLKHIFGRARPEPRSSEGPYSWGHVHLDMMGPYTSFPSTHTTVYYAYATLLGKALGQEWMSEVFGTALYFLEVGTHHHWLSDMWVSYLLGKSIATYVWEKRTTRDFRNEWLIYPVFVDEASEIYPGFGVARFF